MNNVLYFDVEWANSKNRSICQMGLVSEDFETGDPVFPEQTLYINPMDGFDKYCVDVHGITKDKVKDCDAFDVAWRKISNYFTNSVIVGHNVKSADLDALVKNLHRYNIDVPVMYCIDTYELAKRFVPSFEVKNYTLSALCEYFDIDMDNEHDAFDDACACSDLLKTMVETYDIEIDDYVEKYEAKGAASFTSFIPPIELHREINQLYGVVYGIAIDSIITEKETEYIKRWRDEHAEYALNLETEGIMKVLNQILEDNVITLEEMNELRSALVNYVQSISASIETLATQQLQGILSGIKADNVISNEELLELKRWLYENDYLIGHYPYDKLIAAITAILEDGVVTAEEMVELSALFDKLFNPLKEITDTVVEFKDNSFCLSGDFIHGKKSDVENYIKSKGGTIDKNVKKSTKYVVVGGKGSSEYANGSYGTKIKKALELSIPVLKENQIY